MTMEEIAAAAVYMACQPPHVNVLELIQLLKPAIPGKGIISNSRV